MTFWRGIVLAGLVTLIAEGALAQAPTMSPRPVPRAVAAPVDATTGQRGFETFIQNLIHPKPRPPRVVQVASPMTVQLSPRPVPRPQNLLRLFNVSAAGMAASTRRQPRRGSVCGVREIRGEPVAAIPGKIRGCGVSAPVRVTEVSGVKLSQAALIDCDTAKALNSWVKSGVVPAIGRLGGGVASLRIVAHYSCRTRNNRPGAKISEHGKGHAVDVAGFTLKNGVTINVLNGWGDAQQGRILKAIHRAACGPFGTVLGPNADRYHRDHFHVDTARYRSGSYCR